MHAELREVRGLFRIVGVMRVDDMHDVEAIRRKAACPSEELRDRPRRRVETHEPLGFDGSDVKPVGDRGVPRDRRNEVALKALRDQDAVDWMHRRLATTT
jgi:hypothetical protein